MQTGSSGAANIPFGDSNSLVTGKTNAEESLTVDLDFSTITDEGIEDVSGTKMVAMTVNDFRINYTEDKKSSKGTDMFKQKIDNDKKAY